MSYQAYQKASARSEDPRMTEYRLMGMITRQLIEAKDFGIDRIKDKVATLHRNRRVWTCFATDCADENNQLPDSVRAGIISLSLFVDRETSEVMRGRGDIDSLIDINKMIMQGLAPQDEASGPSALAG